MSVGDSFRFRGRIHSSLNQSFGTSSLLTLLTVSVLPSKKANSPCC